MDCASTILPITPPAEFAAHMSTGSRLSCCAVIRCRLPNSAFDDVSLPVSATHIEPRVAGGEPQAQHEGNREHGELHALQGGPEDLPKLGRPHPEQESGDDRG